MSEKIDKKLAKYLAKYITRLESIKMSSDLLDQDRQLFKEYYSFIGEWIIARSQTYSEAPKTYRRLGDVFTSLSRSLGAAVCRETKQIKKEHCAYLKKRDKK